MPLNMVKKGFLFLNKDDETMNLENISPNLIDDETCASIITNTMADDEAGRCHLDALQLVDVETYSDSWLFFFNLL